MSNRNIQIDAVTVCVDYSDWLEECISNLNVVDSWTIVTVSKDKKTQSICNQKGLSYVFTDRLYSDNSFFAKGKAINDGLKSIKAKDWILHIDSDILLPKNFQQIIMEASLDKTCIYGCARQHNGEKRIEINPKTGEEHKRPLIGFFQLWHSEQYSDYPEDSAHAGDDDQNMSLRFNWPGKWKFLDMCVEDVSGEFCKHWYGRKFHKRAKAICKK